MSGPRMLPDLLDDYYVARHSKDDQRKGEAFDAIADLITAAPRVWDDGLPPGGWVCGACGQPVESESCEKHQVSQEDGELRAALTNLLPFVPVRKHPTTPTHRRQQAAIDAARQALASTEPKP